MFSVPERYRIRPESSDITWYTLCVSSRLFQTHTYDFLHSFTVWIPAREVVVRSGDDCYTDYEPLFPGYIFVGVVAGNTPGELERLARAYNASFSLLKGVDGRYHAMPSSDLDAMVSAADSGCSIRPTLSVGSRVRIISGPLRGIVGVVIPADGRGIRVKLRAYSKDVELTIRRDPEVFLEAYAEN